MVLAQLNKFKKDLLGEENTPKENNKLNESIKNTKMKKIKSKNGKSMCIWCFCCYLFWDKNICIV